MMWNILVFSASLLLLIFLFWKEIKRGSKQRLVLRLLTSFLAVASLVCLAVPPFYSGKRSINTEHDFFLLTDGFSKDSLHLQQSSSPQKPLIFTADEAVFKTLKSPQVRFIADLDLWRKTVPTNTTVHILGDGLSEDELKNLDRLPVQFNVPKLPTGIQKINWTHRLHAGENFRVQGNFLNQNNGEIKLVLKGLNTSLDSVKIGAKRSMNFSFSSIPKQSGEAVFRLLALSGKDTLENEPLPLTIEPEKMLKVLMLSASPDFESRFLKNWLAENAYAVAARSTISKNKTTTDFGNMSKQPLEKITPALLHNFDVLICDASEFGNLSKAEIAAILAQTSRKGLGLIFRADSANTSFIRQNFAVYPSNDLQKQLNLKLNDASGLRLNIQTEHPSFIKNQAGSQVLVQDQTNHLVVSNKLYGAGRLILSTLNNTFSWQLSGKTKEYAAYWSLLISKAARKITQKQTVSTLIYADKNSMVPIRLNTSTKNISAQIDGANVAFQQNQNIPFLQESVYWPRKSGWIMVNADKNLPTGIYVFENLDWKALKLTQKINLTETYARKFASTQTKNQNQQQTELIFIPSLLFYLIFLLSCAFLWFETKLL
ncbi:MAG: hypothetical protein ACRYFB_10955 [Janthinobacterium lividum]